eukprot:g4659.t1
MNITRENFEATFDKIREAIRTSHFIALDAEFTGLRLPGAAEKMMDSVQTRWNLARGSCSQFMLTQYGVCCFRYNDDDDDGSPGRLEARPFNCFVVPSTKFGSDRVYSCQASSMDFLGNHGFDFQAWAAHGVPFLSRAEEEAIKGRLKARWEREAAAAAEKKQAAAVVAAAAAAAAAAPTTTGDAGPPVAPPVHTARDGTTIESLEEPEKGMVKDALSKVKALLAESCSGDKYVQTSVKLDPMNGRQRWLMHEFVGSSTSDVKLCNLPGPAHARPMEIRTVCKDPEQQAKTEAKLRAEDEARQLNDLRRAVGFRRVVEEVFKAGKPVVCHNGLLDLLHTHDKFVGPIPEDLDSGTKALHSLVPRLFDSKVVMSKAIASGMRFPRTVLGEAHEWLRATFPAPAQTPAPPSLPSPPQTNGGAGAEASEQAIEQSVGTEGAPRHADSGEGANGDSTNNGKKQADGLEGGGQGGGKIADSEASAAAATERTRKGWDAVFAPGFEERYEGGGQEHEAAYDAYLTGCCFAAAATVGLGVGLDELRRMAIGGETPASLAPVMNVVPLYRVFGGQKICLPGPAPPLDLSRYVHVRGFPSAARTDAILTPIRAVGGCEETWFHWIDDTSGVAECKTVEGAAALLEAAATAAAKAEAAATEAAGVSESTERVVDPLRLLLEDLTLTQMNHAFLAGGGKPAEGEEGSGREGEKRGAKRPRQDGETEG